ncbi:MAG: hypothetical protein M3N08_01365 [Pseudomonadota bacterium]|nr:hypothetical protein [Pseudomonadota bacterium]
MENRRIKLIILFITAIPILLMVVALLIGNSDPSDNRAIGLRNGAYIVTGTLFLFLAGQQLYLGRKKQALIALLMTGLLFFDPLHRYAKTHLMGQSFFAGLF